MTGTTFPRVPLGLVVTVLLRYGGRREVLLVAVLQLLVALSEGVGLTLLVPIFSAVGGSAPMTLLGVRLTPAVVLSAVLVALVLRAAAQWLLAVRSSVLRLRTTDGLRLEALEAVLQAEWRYVSGQQRQHLLQQLTTEMQRAGAAIDLLSRAVVSALLLVAAAVAAVVISPEVGGVALVATALLGLVARGTVGRSAASGTALGHSIERFGAVLGSSLAVLHLVRAHDAAAAWLALVRREAATGRQIQQEYARRSARVRFALAVAGVMGLLGLLGVARAFGVGSATLLALAVVTARLLTGTQALLTQLHQFANLAPAVVRATESAATARAHAETRAAVPTPPTEAGEPPQLRLRDVVVCYPDASAPALGGVDLVVPAGQVTVLTGPSGSGKSTLLDVVLGLLRPDSGALLVDGLPVTDLAAWRSRVGYAPQQVTLAPGTVWDNLVWSVVPGHLPTEQQVWQALTEAQVDAAVRRLPAGLHTELGGTTRLSGGEQQRLGIARALLRQPALLVLDEATNALDAATEQAVLEAVARPGRTVVLVTHRPELVVSAAQVVRLEDGLVVSRNARAVVLADGSR